MSDPVLLCRHVYPAGGRCKMPPDAEVHRDPAEGWVHPAVAHEYVPGVLVPWPPDYEAIMTAVYEAGEPWSTIDTDQMVTNAVWRELVGVAVDAALLGVDDDH